MKKEAKCLGRNITETEQIIRGLEEYTYIH